MMQTGRLLAVSLAAAFALVGCKSSTPSPATPGSAPAEQDPPANLPPEAAAEFTIEPGDTVVIDVYKHNDLDVTAKVPLTGVVQVPLIGEVKVFNRTLDDIRGEIARRLGEKYIVNPQVTVQVTQMAPRRVYVLGEVKQAREVIIPEGGKLYLLQLISAAGGLAETAYKKDVKLIRTSKDRITRQMFRIPLHKIEAGEVADILLTPEDVVIVPHTTKIVYVLGAVRSPGGYAIPQTGLTAAQAVAMAGGLGKFAAAGSVQILRQGPERKQIVVSVELDKVLAGDLSSDRDLQPGDILVVPTGFW